MFPKIDPKQMNALMKQMGIKNEEIPASRVVIECAGKNILVENPSVTLIDMKGEKSFQISGDVREEEVSGLKEDDDAEIIMAQTDCTRQEAEQALREASGDIAQAILKITEAKK